MENCMKTRLTDWVVQKKWTYHRFGIYGINDRHKLVGCISFLRTVAVLLLLFWRLSCKASYSAFLYGEAVPVKKWKVLFVVVNTTVQMC